MSLLEQLGATRSGDASALVYGTPQETPDGSVIVTVARVGGILRSAPRPVGVYVVKDGQATWTPAVDANRIALFGQTIGLVSATLALLAIVRRPPWPDLSR
ncbi:hypothetical protein ACFYT3_04515 [Nocardia amikacinitolerans]|uniref:hypothetical protein n=1 Tax=Nocardia amikacinitolerans TaxID=756689 RepID=UPI0020A56A4B|nr:hypothetical protein [Nocardia amikacinitolerans]MCP2288610.1 hypothetical protein [Nocardia amikacinitolerans]